MSNGCTFAGWAFANIPYFLCFPSLYREKVTKFFAKDWSNNIYVPSLSPPLPFISLVCSSLEYGFCDAESETPMLDLFTCFFLLWYNAKSEVGGKQMICNYGFQVFNLFPPSEEKTLRGNHKYPGFLIYNILNVVLSVRAVISTHWKQDPQYSKAGAFFLSLPLNTADKYRSRRLAMLESQKMERDRIMNTIIINFVSLAVVPFS